jgi:type IV pilus assembly protein PilY1
MLNRVVTLNNNVSGALGPDASHLIAGLAFHAATQDIRPDFNNAANQPRGQNVSTYWLDVLEFGAYLPNNQYYLATKFGGLKIPTNVTFDPLTATAASIQDSWWHTNTDTVGGQPRPDNYYTVADPDAMIRGLRKTFVNIVNDKVGSSASLAANSTRLDTNTVTFQAQFRSGVLR